MSEPNTISRRQLAGVLAAGAAAPALAAQQPSTQPATLPAAPQPRRGPAPEVPPFEAPIEFTRKDVPAKVQPFPMTAVRLLPGAYLMPRSGTAATCNVSPADRLLYNFRENAGLPVGSAPPFGGWEAKADGKRGTELRGHFTGHFLSASAQLYASAGDKEAKAKGDELVAEMAKCQEKLGGGYLSAFPMELFDRLDKLSGQPAAPTGTRTALGAVLHHPQDHGRALRHVQPGRQSAGAESGRGHGGLGRPVERLQVRRAHAADSQRGIRRHRRDAVQPGGRHQQRPVGQGRRPLHQEALRQSPGLAPRRAARPARQHARPASDRRRPPLRNLGRHALPRRGRFLLVRGDRRAQLRDRRHQQRRKLARAAAAARRRIEDEHLHRRMLLRLQHDEAHAPPLRLEPRPALFRLLRARDAQSPPGHHPAGERLHAVLPVALSRAPGRPSTARTNPSGAARARAWRSIPS